MWVWLWVLLRSRGTGLLLNRRRGACGITIGGHSRSRGGVTVPLSEKDPRGAKGVCNFYPFWFRLTGSFVRQL